MASRTGMFLKEEDRAGLIQELKNKGELRPGEVPEEILKCAEALEPTPEASFGTGCLTCGEDDDHPNLLLCEGCNDEYHTYCLDPPLRSVPAADWFCERCKMPPFEDDGLDKLIGSLPPKWTSRFGEVCWAQGGVGFGWWPAFIYDPRFTVGSARQLARKNLGKRHLLYFFECHDAPFAVLPDSKISKWEDGLIDDYHLGRAARASGKARTRAFQQAIQAATVEAGKPVEMRMNWNHNDQPQILPSPKTAQPKRVKTRKRTRHETPESTFEEKPILETHRVSQKELSTMSVKQRFPRGFGLLPESASLLAQSQIFSRQNLAKAMEAVSAAHRRSTNQIELPEGGDLFCRIFKRCVKSSGIEIINIGFVKLESRKLSTYADARVCIDEQLVPDCIDFGMKWNFFVPALGPVSRKQEETLGPMLHFLMKTTGDPQLGSGTSNDPLKVMIIETSKDKEDD